MRDSLRKIGPFLLITLFGLPLITPLLRWTAVPCTHDGHLHYHRVAAMRHAWENGLYFTRWLPDLAFGYGYPFFVYREPTPLYAVLFPHLAGLPLPAASNLFYALTILACGWLMFLWARDVLGERGALVAAVAYMAAPYVLVDSLIRGNSPEALALPLFPLLLWAGRRWLLGGRGRFFLTAVFGLAFLSLSHNISTLIFAPTLLVYLLVLGWRHRLERRPLLGRVLLLFGLGLGMTIFYTGGALLEMDQVTLQQSTTTRNNDFRFNFTTAGELLAPPRAEDPNLVNPFLPFRLGWTQVGLAAIGVAVLLYGVWRGRREEKENALAPDPYFHGWLMLLGTAVYLFMSLEISRPLWEALPLIDFVQFPWRFVGRAALPLAFLAGLPFASRNTQHATRNTQHAHRLPITAYRSLILLPLALLILEAFPALYPSICKEDPYPTIVDVHTYEHESGLVGVDPEGSYFPRTVARRPKSSPLEADYRAGRPPQRVDREAIPEDAEVREITYRPLGAAIQLTAPRPFTARYLSFAFPGWEATVDGDPVPITPGDPGGLITFPIPAGEHTVRVAWRSTPLRTGLVTISLLTLAATLGIAALRKPSSAFALPSPDNTLSRNTQHATRPTDYRSPITDYRLLLTLPLLLLAAKLLVDRIETPLRRPSPPPVATPQTLQGGELRLDGYTLSRETAPAGDTFDIHMAWTAVAPPQVDYQSNVWIVGPDGLMWSGKGTERPRLYEDAPPTRLWGPGQWGWDSREVQVFAGTPPGRYDVILTLFDKATLQPVTLTRLDGTVLGPTAVLGQIQVTMPPDPPTFSPQYPLNITLSDNALTLLGYSQDRETAAPGESVLLTLFWQKEAGETARRLAVELINGGGTAVHTWPIVITRSDFDLDEWRPGERLRGQHLLRLPAGLESGRYQFKLAEVALGTIQVEAPQRAFAAPAMETAVSVPFSDDAGRALAALAGYTLERPEPDTLSLTLLWRAEAEMETAYRVFVHLVDGNGRLLAQSDAEPVDWTRPTTGWTPGEYLVDPHTLTGLSAAIAGAPRPLTLHIGLYTPDTNHRLQTPTGDAFILAIGN